VKGAAHFREAERCLKAADDWDTNEPPHMAYLVTAQVHATLALTKATLVGMEVDDWDDADG
jgi:hypothetical protein